MDQAHEWILDQACAEARKEAKAVKVNLPGDFSVEVSVTPTALAATFGTLCLVLLGVIGYLLKLLRAERSQNSLGPLAAILPPHRAAARFRRGPPAARVPPLTAPVAGALDCRPAGATATPPSPSPSSLYQDAV